MRISVMCWVVKVSPMNQPCMSYPSTILPGRSCNREPHSLRRLDTEPTWFLIWGRILVGVSIPPLDSKPQLNSPNSVISLLASGIILGLLLLHWVVEFKSEPPIHARPKTPVYSKIQIRVAGRHFMLQNTMLMALIALTALIFSRIVSASDTIWLILVFNDVVCIQERWTYLQVSTIITTLGK